MYHAHKGVGAVQVMVFQTLADKHGGLKRFSPTGTSVMVQGEIKATPEGVKQVPF